MTRLRCVVLFLFAMIGAAFMQFSAASAQTATPAPLVYAQAPVQDNPFEWLSEDGDDEPEAAGDDDFAVRDEDMGPDEGDPEAAIEAVPGGEEVAQESDALSEDEPASTVSAPSDTATAPDEPSSNEAETQERRTAGEEPSDDTAAETAGPAPDSVATAPGSPEASEESQAESETPASDVVTSTDPARTGASEGEADTSTADAATPDAGAETPPAQDQAENELRNTEGEPEQARTEPRDRQTDEAGIQTADDADDTGADRSQSASDPDGSPQDAQRDSETEVTEPAVDPSTITMTVATWAGAYGQAQDRAIFKPFTQEHGYNLETVVYDGDYQKLVDQANEPKWSLVDLNSEAMIRACDEQRLEKLDHSILASAPDETPLSKDFLPGAVHECGIASAAWSAVVVYDERLETGPSSIADFFDTARFPGKRLLPKQPRYSLELALLADGVPADQVYERLKTSEGRDQAFAKLLTIKDDIVWWEKPSEVFDRIVNKEAAMGLAFNGRAFMAIEGAKQPLRILWDGQIYAFDYWAIPKDAPAQDAAKTFIRFATSPAPLAEQARWIPYGPSRRSAVEQVGKHAALDLDMKPYLPTYAPNLSGALAFDGAFWRTHEAALKDRFANWVDGRQLPPQKPVALSQ